MPSRDARGVIIPAAYAMAQLACAFYAVLCSIRARALCDSVRATRGRVEVSRSSRPTREPMGAKVIAPTDSPSSRPTHAHLVQLFDAPRSLADAVSHYLI